MVSCLPWPLQTSWHANARLSTKCMEFVQAGGFWFPFGSFRVSLRVLIVLTANLDMLRSA